jgi:hypothetical protein
MSRHFRSAPTAHWNKAALEAGAVQLSAKVILSIRFRCTKMLNVEKDFSIPDRHSYKQTAKNLYIIAHL